MQKRSVETIKYYLYVITLAKDYYRDYTILNARNYTYKRGARRL